MLRIGMDRTCELRGNFKGKGKIWILILTIRNSQLKWLGRIMRETCWGYLKREIGRSEFAWMGDSTGTRKDIYRHTLLSSTKHRMFWKVMKAHVQKVHDTWQKKIIIIFRIWFSFSTLRNSNEKLCIISHEGKKNKLGIIFTFYFKNQHSMIYLHGFKLRYVLSISVPGKPYSALTTLIDWIIG